MSTEIAKKRILEKVPLGSLISEQVQLSLRSGRQVGLCPFHGEKSPSFTIFDDHYFCFGCRARGDAIEYVRHTQGLNFIEALKYLAEKYSIDVPELDDSRKAQESRQQTAKLYRILQTAQKYFQTSLKEQGGHVVAYLESRGFTKESIANFGFGYAPDQGMGLVNLLLRQGHSLKDANLAAVATQSKKDLKTYDFFRNRLTIPIQDQHGRLIAFGGRAMDNHPAKYKNSRESPLFDKSHVLFGLDRAKEWIRKSRRSIVVEGYMDALQLWNHGFPETVACLGTALTPFHMQRLSNLTETVYLIFDGDQAGKHATLRSVSHALDIPKAQFKVVRLPQQEDPDSFVVRHGPEGLEAALSLAKDLLDFAISSIIDEAHDLEIPDLIQRDITPWLKTVRDPVRQSFLVSKVAKLTGVDVETIRLLLKPRQGAQTENTSEVPASQARSRDSQLAEKPAYTRKLTNIEYDFLGHVYFSEPSCTNIDDIEGLLNLDLELEPLWQDLCREFLSCLRKKQVPQDLDLHLWHTSSELAVIRLLENFRAKRSAFETHHRGEMIRKLGRMLRLKQLQQTVSVLKKRMGQVENQEQMEILLAISKLNSEIKELAH